MGDRLIISLFLLAISSVLAITSSWAVIKPARKAGGNITVNIPVLGTITTNYLAMGVAFLSLTLGYFVYSLWKDQPLDMVNVDGTVTIDPASLGNVSAVLIGVTSSPWNQTVTPGGDGKLNLKIPVPKTWNTYTAYAFAYGAGNVRPAVVGVNLGDPRFVLELKP